MLAAFLFSSRQSGSTERPPKACGRNPQLSRGRVHIPTPKPNLFSQCSSVVMAVCQFHEVGEYSGTHFNMYPTAKISFPCGSKEKKKKKKENGKGLEAFVDKTIADVRLRRTLRQFYDAPDLSLLADRARRAATRRKGLLAFSHDPVHLRTSLSRGVRTTCADLSPKP